MHALDMGMSRDGSLSNSNGILPSLSRTPRQAPPPVQDDHSDKSTRTIRQRKKKGTRTTQVGRKTNKRHDRCVAISDDENEKKMKGKRSFVLGLATFSCLWTSFLGTYWNLHCSDTSPKFSKTLKDVGDIGYVFLILTVGLVAAHALQFKDGELSDSAGFLLLQIVQALVLICLWAGTIIPLRFCRRMPHLVVWPCATGGLLIIFISWSLVFQPKMLIMCTKTTGQMVTKYTRASCQMVIKCKKVMYDKAQKWLLDLSLPECIKAKFKKMPERNEPGMTRESV